MFLSSIHEPVFAVPILKYLQNEVDRPSLTLIQINCFLFSLSSENSESSTVRLFSYFRSVQPYYGALDYKDEFLRNCYWNGEIIWYRSKSSVLKCM